jgi:hypothetical protein
VVVRAYFHIGELRIIPAASIVFFAYAYYQMQKIITNETRLAQLLERNAFIADIECSMLLRGIFLFLYFCKILLIIDSPSMTTILY